MSGSFENSCENCECCDGCLQADLKNCAGDLCKDSVDTIDGCEWQNDDGTFVIEKFPNPGGSYLESAEGVEVCIDCTWPTLKAQLRNCAGDMCDAEITIYHPEDTFGNNDGVFTRENVGLPGGSWKDSADDILRDDNFLVANLRNCAGDMCKMGVQISFGMRLANIDGEFAYEGSDRKCQSLPQ